MKYSIRTLISSRKFFFGTILLLLLLFLLSPVSGEKSWLMPVNANHPFWLNVFFVNYTFMGDGIFAICLSAVFIFYFKKKEQGTALLVGFLLSEIVVQSLKNIYSFTGPMVFLEPGQHLFITDTISTDQGNLISGHTAIAFAIATVLILVVKNSNWQLPLLAMAMLLGYSRIYLAQSYLSEIITGIVVGTVSGIASVYLAYHFNGYRHFFKKFFSMNKSVVLSTERNIQSI